MLIKTKNGMFKCDNAKIDNKMMKAIKSFNGDKAVLKTKNGDFKLVRVNNASDAEDIVIDFMDKFGFDEMGGWQTEFHKQNKEFENKVNKYFDEAKRKGEDKEKRNKKLDEFINECKALRQKQDSKFKSDLAKVTSSKEKILDKANISSSKEKDIQKKLEDEQKKEKEKYAEILGELEQYYLSRKGEEKKAFDKRLDEIKGKYEKELEKIKKQSDGLKREVLGILEREIRECQYIYETFVKEEGEGNIGWIKQLKKM